MTSKQINQIKQEIRTGKPVAIIADELAKEWKRPVNGVYHKVLRLSKMTRKIVNTYEGPTKRPYVRKKAPRPAIVKEAVTMDFDPMPGSLWDNFDKRMEEIAADIASGELLLPPGISIARRMIEPAATENIEDPSPPAAR